MAGLTVYNIEMKSWRELLNLLGYKGERAKPKDFAEIEAFIRRRLCISEPAKIQAELLRRKAALHGITAPQISANAKILLGLLLVNCDAVQGLSGLDLEGYLAAKQELINLTKG